jgi:uncharacterized membrane protein
MSQDTHDRTLENPILLIAAKRSDQIASELAMHDYQTDQQAFARIESVHARLEDVANSNRALLEQIIAMLQQPKANPAP